MLHQPDLAGDELVDGICVVIPKAIRKIMQDNWKEYIPLTLLTTAHLKSSDTTRKLQTPICLASGRKGLELMATTDKDLVPPKDEAAMDFQEWLQAWNHLLDLIDIYIPQATSAWEQHWKMIWQHRERDTRWHCLMRYCIEVRKAAVRANMNPGVWQAKIWQEIIDDDRDRIAAGRPPPGSRPSQPSTNSQHDKPATSSHSFQRRSDAPSASDQKPARKTCGDQDLDKCFRCGTYGHLIRDCNRDFQYNGGKIHVTKVGNTYMLDSKPFCYRFNTPKGCHIIPCPNPPHICSLCRATDHGAQQCRV